MAHNRIKDRSGKPSNSSDWQNKDYGDGRALGETKDFYQDCSEPLKLIC